MRSTQPALLEPPSDDRVTRTEADAWRRMALLAAICGLTASGLQAIRLISPALLGVEALNLLVIPMAILPGVVWILLSWWDEQLADQPRTQTLLLGAFILIAVYAIVLPLVSSFYQVEDWLPLASAIDRILGYTFTVGIPQIGVIYSAILFIVWRTHIFTRQDVVAYCMTAAVAYTCAENLHYLTQTQPTLDTAALRFFSNLAISVSSAVILAYGLAQTRFSDPLSLLLPATLLVAAIIIGIFIPIQAGLGSGTLQAGLSDEGPSQRFIFTRPLFSLGIAAAVLVLTLVVIRWLLTSAERRAREAESIERLDVVA
jgi:hypothetical protein